MTYIVAYDIEDDRIREKLARYLLTMGVRLQKSVYAIEVSSTLLPKIKRKMVEISGAQGTIAIFRQCSGCGKNALAVCNEKKLYHVF